MAGLPGPQKRQCPGKQRYQKHIVREPTREVRWSFCGRLWQYMTWVTWLSRLQEALRGFDASKRDICMNKSADGLYTCLVYSCGFRHDRPAAIMRHIAHAHSPADCPRRFNRLMFFVGSTYLAKGWVGKGELLCLDIRQS